MKRLEKSKIGEVANRNIRAQMGLRGESALSLSQRTGRSYSYIRNRLAGDGEWALSDLELIAGIWGVTVTELLSSEFRV